ncbi:M23 family metallopeptidase [uncultured Bacteroides sp.]|uniref:M23 family metallopeptidase n=1 Tax=uncultured Bacteroides sp. TaxID=162156 RepID=UPI002AA77021|nr:M23 family metallopeptidase [uncultured Bacteroides sp.]
MIKRLLYVFLCCFSLSVGAQQSHSCFSPREISDIRVATPGLFEHGNKLLIDLGAIPATEFAFPLPGAKVISGYASRKRKGHSGVDIKTCAKDTIYCAFSGIVRMAKPYSGYGNVIVVRHASGLETVYSHNFLNFVKSGDEVKAGQAIALTGRTGRATTEHLHFETRINGQHFNPNLIFNFQEGTLRKGCIQCAKKGRGVSVKAL